MFSKVCLLLAGLFGGSAVLLGALEAHVLKTQVEIEPIPVSEMERRLENEQTAVRYQMVHALTLLAVGVLTTQRRHFLLAAAAGAFTLGLLLFCGGLHVYAYTGERAAVSVVPFGGGLLIMGWLALGGGGFLSATTAAAVTKPAPP